MSPALGTCVFSVFRAFDEDEDEEDEDEGRGRFPFCLPLPAAAPTTATASFFFGLAFAFAFVFVLAGDPFTPPVALPFALLFAPAFVPPFAVLAPLLPPPFPTFTAFLPPPVLSVCCSLWYWGGGEVQGGEGGGWGATVCQRCASVRTYMNLCTLIFITYFPLDVVMRTFTSGTTWGRGGARDNLFPIRRLLGSSR